MIGKIVKSANDIYATCTDQGKNMTKALNIPQNAQDQMKVIHEIYGDEFIIFDDEEKGIGDLVNEEGNYSEAQLFALKNQLDCSVHPCFVLHMCVS